MNGIELIARERMRQIQEELWTAEHDDTHRNAEMNRAARSYLLAAIDRKDSRAAQDEIPPYCWPWARKWWKPSDDPIRNLVKAGALITAEIDRLQRRKAKSQNKEVSEPARKPRT